MHLKAIKLRGFKSFVDPVEIRLEPGVAVVVGPNGSGKSNVSDSILWATGSMSPGELRAEKPDDVLFAGSAGRQPTDFCEVELLFDNADGAWPDLPFSEVSVARRLHRGGEGQYLVNSTPVRRIDLVELLSDVGLGGGLRSVISQGRVETVLNSKPSERRELIEEAAGLGRFKRRRHRAELKLARVAVQVERARDLEDEVKKRLRPLALQATAAERAEKLGVEIARLQAAIATLDLARLAAAARRGRRTAYRERGGAARARREDRGARRRARARRGGADRLGGRARAGHGCPLPAAQRRRAHRPAPRVGSLAQRVTARRARRRPAPTTRRARPTSRPPHAAPPPRRSRRPPSARGSRWRPRSAGRASRRSSAAHRPCSPRSSTTCSPARSETESHLTGGGRDALLALRGASQRLGVRHESAQRLLAELRSELAEVQRAPTGPSPAQLGQAADEADAAARAAVREQDDLDARVRLARERLTALEQSLAEREGLPPAARALAEEGEQLALQLLEVARGRGALRRPPRSATAPRPFSPPIPSAGLELLERASSLGLGSVIVLVGRDPRELVDVPVVPRAQLLASKVPAVTEDGIGWDPERGELWFAGETAEAVLLELDARRRELRAEVEELAGAGDGRRGGRRRGRGAGARGRRAVRAGRAPAQRPPRGFVEARAPRRRRRKAR